MEWIIDRLRSLFSFDGDTLGAVLVVLVVTATLGLVGRIFTAAFAWVQSVQFQRAKRRRIMIDLIIYLHFAKTNWAQIVTPGQIARIKAMIDAEAGDGKGWRLYVATSDDQEIIDGLRDIRQTFETGELARLDATLASAQLFLSYYRSLGSDAFAELSATRKKAIVDELKLMHGALVTCIDELLKAGEIATLRNRLQKTDALPILHDRGERS